MAVARPGGHKLFRNDTSCLSEELAENLIQLDEKPDAMQKGTRCKKGLGPAIFFPLTIGQKQDLSIEYYNQDAATTTTANEKSKKRTVLGEAPANGDQMMVMLEGQMVNTKTL